MFILKYFLNGEVFSLKIGIEDINRLHPHEEVVEKSYKKLVKAFRKSEFMLHPIIVDEKSRVVLDGMHRLKALKELGYPHILVCLVDYFNPLIRVGNWYRVFEGVTLNDIFSIIKHFEKIKIFERENVKLSRKEFLTKIGIMGENKVIVIEEENTWLAYQVVKKIDEMVLKFGGRIKYLTEREALEIALKNPNIIVCLLYTSPSPRDRG